MRKLLILPLIALLGACTLFAAFGNDTEKRWIAAEADFQTQQQIVLNLGTVQPPIVLTNEQKVEFSGINQRMKDALDWYRLDHDAADRELAWRSAYQAALSYWIRING